jgi:hypothetical protein
MHGRNLYRNAAWIAFEIDPKMAPRYSEATEHENHHKEPRVEWGEIRLSPQKTQERIGGRNERLFDSTTTE